MRKATKSTCEALKSLPGASTGFKENAALRAAISDALHGKPMSLRRENALRCFLGLPPLREPVAIEPCPVHGSVHVCDCGGQDGAPAWLPPGARVRPAPRPRAVRVYISDVAPGLLSGHGRAIPIDDLARAIRERYEMP